MLKNIYKNQRTFEQIEANLSKLNIKKGGTYFSANKQYFSDEGKLAIIVPYRDRETNLKIFIEYMHQFLTLQNLTYQIFLIEPEKNVMFNRGLLLNIGYLEALKEIDFDCFVLHDVDMLPENLDNQYICNKNYPTQMAISVSIYKYLEKAPNYFINEYTGGVTSYSKDIFRKINGYSNLFFGWGGEDDDVNIRSMKHFKNISRLDPERGRYFANCHQEDKVINHKRFEMLDSSLKNSDTDGLSNIKYSVLNVFKTKLFTKIIVAY